MRRLLWIPVSVLAAAAAAAAAVAAAPPLPGEGTAIGQPMAITKPGKYVVVRNLTAPGVVLDIQSGDVTLDLNGFTVETTSLDEPAIRAHQVPKENVMIRNGSVRGVKTCVFLDRVTRLTLEDLSVSGCESGVYLDDNDSVVFERNRIGATKSGVFVDNCKSCRIAQNTFIGSVEAGLTINSARASRIEGNTFHGTLHGIQVGGTAVVVRDNVVQDCGTALELKTHDSSVEGNLFSGCRVGLAFAAQSQGNVYRANIARGNNTDFADAGPDNTSHGDNYLPGKQ